MLRRSSLKFRQHVSRYFSSPQQQRTFEQTLEQCKHNKVDMASTSSSDFLQLQFNLIAYRFSRLGHELGQIYMHPFQILPSLPMSVFHLVALPITFFVGLTLGKMQLDNFDSPPTLPYASSRTPSKTEEELEA